MQIGERWTKYGSRGDWPEYEVFPTTPWNYGLVLDERNPSKSFKITKKSWPASNQPFTPESSPIQLMAKGKRISVWKQDSQGLIGKLQPSPVRSDSPVEQITLIPMGAARLRVSALPVIGEGANAHEWQLPKPLPVSASHCFEADTVEALIDGKEPKSSNDHSIPRFTWWDHRGTSEWVQQEFEKPRTISRTEVYWFDDTGAGACRVPESWRLLYRQGGQWKPVEASGNFGGELNKYNVVNFKPVQTTALRIEVKLRPEFSGGILEWKVGE